MFLILQKSRTVKLYEHSSQKQDRIYVLPYGLTVKHHAFSAKLTSEHNSSYSYLISYQKSIPQNLHSLQISNVTLKNEVMLSCMQK